MNHEQRIKKLEKEITELKTIIKSLGLNKKFIPLSQAANVLKVSHSVLRNKIKKDSRMIAGKHFQKNGYHYLIDVKEYQKLIDSDVAAMRQ